MYPFVYDPDWRKLEKESTRGHMPPVTWRVSVSERPQSTVMSSSQLMSQLERARLAQRCLKRLVLDAKPVEAPSPFSTQSWFYCLQERITTTFRILFPITLQLVMVQLSGQTGCVE